MLQSPETLTADEQDQLSVRVYQIFSPNAPIDKKKLFAGRQDQIGRVLDATFHKGQHVILFGERGVGKTSLASVLHDFLNTAGKEVFAPRVNCDSTDNFDTLWKKIFSNIEITLPDEQKIILADQLKDTPITPFLVQKSLSEFTPGMTQVIIFDEFDSVRDENAKKLFAETIKTLSDHAVPATVVLVGVADTVEDLLREHLSIDRCLLQVRMPRMEPAELKPIISNISTLKMGIEDTAIDRIVNLSQGLPMYTHLLGLHATLSAIRNGVRNVRLPDVDLAIEKAMEGVHQSIKSSYIKATTSPKKENFFEEALLACALAKADDLGYFAPSDVREPFQRIMKNASYDIPHFVRHMNAFCEPARGPALNKTGVERRFRYRFVNPLMQPYIIMRGLREKMISYDLL